jgi:hypothetical protein
LVQDEPFGLFVGPGVVDVLARDMSGVDLPARVRGTSDDAVITFHAPDASAAWEYPALDFVAVLERPIRKLPG